MRGLDCSTEKVFEAHCIFHHPRKHTITPYNSSDAGLTATAAVAAAAAAAHSESARHILFSARQQRVPSSDGSSVLSMTFSQPRCCWCARVGDSSNATTAIDEAGEGSPRTKRTLCSRKSRDKDVRLNTASSWMHTRHPRTREQDTKQFSTDFRLPYSRVSNASRKSTKTNTKPQTRSD